MDGLAPAPWVIHCDGSAIPNPGRMGLGAVLVAPDGTRHALSQATHATGCNNEAELHALVEQLATTTARLPPPIAPRLEPLYAAARELLARFGQAQMQWIPRHRNGEADALARAALGAPSQAFRAPFTAGPSAQEAQGPATTALTAHKGSKPIDAR